MHREYVPVAGHGAWLAVLLLFGMVLSYTNKRKVYRRVLTVTRIANVCVFFSHAQSGVSTGHCTVYAWYSC